MDKWNSWKLPLNDLIFDREKFCDEEGQAARKLLEENEDRDQTGEEGKYCMDPKFNIIILNNMYAYDYCDDEII